MNRSSLPTDPAAFPALRDRVFVLIEDGRLDDALALARTVEAQFPQKGEVPFWIACIHGRRGDGRQAVAALSAGITRDLWWPDDWLLDDDDLSPARGLPGFDDAVAAARRLRAERDAGGVAEEPVVHAPPGGVAPSGVLLVLHGWGGDAVAFSAHWRPAADSGYLVVVPESSQALSPGFFVWNDREIARADVARARSEAVAAHGGAGAPLVVAGFSQGGGLAVELALDGDPAPAAFIALGAGTPEDVVPDAELVARAAARGLRGYVGVGDRDEALEGAGYLARRLHEAGLVCRLEVEAGLAHEVPPDFGRRLPGLLGELLG